MKNIIFLFILMLIQGSCTSRTEHTPAQQQDIKEAPVYFPVTNFIKGQINEIKADGINPVKYITAGNKTDSVWMKITDFDVAFKGFVEPVIDSLQMVNLYDASSFSDETLDTYTFTYAIKKDAPGTLFLKRWDVYINRSDNKVKSIYLVKETPDGKERQYTWQTGKWCKIVSIAKDKTGKQFVEYEETIKWRFD
jgi:hypothetical protein